MPKPSLRPIWTPEDAQRLAEVAHTHPTYPGTLDDPPNPALDTVHFGALLIADVITSGLFAAAIVLAAIYVWDRWVA